MWCERAMRLPFPIAQSQHKSAWFALTFFPLLECRLCTHETNPATLSHAAEPGR